MGLVAAEPLSLPCCQGGLYALRLPCPEPHGMAFAGSDCRLLALTSDPPSPPPPPPAILMGVTHDELPGGPARAPAVG